MNNFVIKSSILLRDILTRSVNKPQGKIEVICKVMLHHWAGISWFTFKVKLIWLLDNKLEGTVILGSTHSMSQLQFSEDLTVQQQDCENEKFHKAKSSLCTAGW